MEKLALGLMSGTSADGCSAVLAAFNKKFYRVLEYKTYSYPLALSIRVLRAAELSVPSLSSLNFELGNLHARFVQDLLKRRKISASRISVIGSHGQTVYHGPSDPFPSTLQIGEPSLIAERTGVTVVADFRPRDLAAGGQGAPLIPYFDQYFFGSGPVRAMQNIGGISNVCVVGKGIGSPIAFDNGPGNCLMDWAVRKIFRGRLGYDANGALARKGVVDLKSVQLLARHPYFSKRPPKSTGREIFNESFVPSPLRKRLGKNPEDIVATLNYFTAFTIADSYKRFILNHHMPAEVVVSGGGAYNKTLMLHLESLLYPIPVVSIEKDGVPAQAKEPLAFAFFALRAIEGKVNHLPGSTGARRACILGKIVPGRNFKGAL